MYIQCQNQVSYGSLYRGSSIKSIMKSHPSKKFKSQLGYIERGIRKNNLHKKENVDVILNYDGGEFYGVISSKEQGIPSNPAYRCFVKPDKESMGFLTEWVKAWDDAYSPEELQKYRRLMDMIKNNIGNKT